jgi:hypothetical protein
MGARSPSPPDVSGLLFREETAHAITPAAPRFIRNGWSVTSNAT